MTREREERGADAATLTKQTRLKPADGSIRQEATRHAEAELQNPRAKRLVRQSVRLGFARGFFGTYFQNDGDGTPRRYGLGLMLRGVCALLVLIGLIGVLPVATGRANELHHAGVIVRHGDGRLTYAYVSFTEDEISGVELLKRTGIPLVTVSFGGLGEGICRIEREGCPASDCRKRVCQGRGNDSPFWQYFRQSSPGKWNPLVLGASSTKVRDGDVDGWSWTPNEPKLPAVSLADVARLAGVSTSASPAAGVVPTAAVRSSAPAAVDSDRSGRQGWLTIAGGACILIGLAGAALVAIRRARPAKGA